MVDFGKWVSEEYRMPGKPVPTADDSKEDSEADIGDAGIAD